MDYFTLICNGETWPETRPDRDQTYGHMALRLYMGGVARSEIFPSFRFAAAGGVRGSSYALSLDVMTR